MTTETNSPATVDTPSTIPYADAPTETVALYDYWYAEGDKVQRVFRRAYQDVVGKQVGTNSCVLLLNTGQQVVIPLSVCDEIVFTPDALVEKLSEGEEVEVAGE